MSDLIQGDITVNNGDYLATGTGTGFIVKPLATAAINLLPNTVGSFVFDSDLLQFKGNNGAIWNAIATTLGNGAKTVGAIDSDYPNFSSAFNDGQFNLYVKNSFTEVADYTFTTNEEINIVVPINCQITYGQYSVLNMGTTSSRLSINGAGIHQYDYTGITKRFIDFDSTPNGQLYLLGGVNIQDISTGVLPSQMIYYPSNGNILTMIDGAFLQYPNKPLSGISIFSGQILNCYFLGGGTSCDDAVNIATFGKIKNCFFINQFNTAVSNVTFGTLFGCFSDNINATPDPINVTVSTFNCIFGNFAIASFPPYNYISTDVNIDAIGESFGISNNVIGTTVSAFENNSYNVNSVGTAISIPTDIALGATFNFKRVGAGNFIVSLNGGQSIIYNGATYTNAVASTAFADSVSLQCTEQSTVLTVISVTGSPLFS